MTSLMPETGLSLLEALIPPQWESGRLWLRAHEGPGVRLLFDPQQLGAAWLPVRAQRAHGGVWICPLARVAGGRTSPVGTSSLAKRFPTD